MLQERAARIVGNTTNHTGDSMEWVLVCNFSPGPIADLNFNLFPETNNQKHGQDGNFVFYILANHGKRWVLERL